MKKKLLFVFMLSGLIMLSACGGNSAESKNSTEVASNEANKKSEADVQKSRDIIDNAKKAVEGIASGTYNTEMELLFKSKEIPNGLIKETRTISYNEDPLYAHKKNVYTNTEEGGDRNDEFYFTPEYVYIKEEPESDWLKVDRTKIPEDLYANLSNYRINQQYQLFDKFLEGFDLKEEEGKYIFTYAGDSEKQKELALELFYNTSLAGGMEDIQVEEMSVVYEINSQNYYPISEKKMVKISAMNGTEQYTVELKSYYVYEKINENIDSKLPIEVQNADEGEVNWQ